MSGASWLTVSAVPPLRTMTFLGFNNCALVFLPVFRLVLFLEVGSGAWLASFFFAGGTASEGFGPLLFVAEGFSLVDDAGTWGACSAGFAPGCVSDCPGTGCEGACSAGFDSWSWAGDGVGCCLEDLDSFVGGVLDWASWGASCVSSKTLPGGALVSTADSRIVVKTTLIGE